MLLLELSTNGRKLIKSTDACKLTTPKLVYSNYETNLSIHIQQEEPLLLGLGLNPRASAL